MKYIHIYPFLFMILVINGCLKSNNPFDDRSFNKEIWIKNVHKGELDSQRGPMADDLIKNHLRIDMHRQDVLTLLGKPDSGVLEEEDLPFTQWSQFNYNLGGWSGFGMDMDVLEIKFDKTGALKRYLYIKLNHTYNA